MNLVLVKKNTYTAAACLSVLFLILAVLRGAEAGKIRAQSRLVAGNARALSQGLRYFYQDQDRYPTALEFANAGVMLGYFNLFPAREFPSGSCFQSFDYKRISDAAFSLNFCLSGKISGLKSGWNSINSGKN
jgi:hypothetical protein